MQIILEKAAKVRLALFDVDGVFTNGHLYFAENNEFRIFHAHDGLGLKMLLASGVQVGIISGHTSPVIATRMKSLGIAPEAIKLGQNNKMPAFEALLQQYQLTAEQVSYVGDDLPDLQLIKSAGLGIAVPNAVELVRQQADWITSKQGGNGAVREICELIMQAQNRLHEIHETYHS